MFSVGGIDPKIDAATIRLNGASVRRQVKSGGGPRCREKDVNQDGFMDLLCYIETNEIEINSGQTKLTLEAEQITEQIQEQMVYY